MLFKIPRVRYSGTWRPLAAERMIRWAPRNMVKPATTLRRVNTGFGITFVLLLLNFTCAHNMRSDLAGLAMNSGLSVTASLLVCVIFAGSVAINLLRTSRQPAWGCVALIAWLVGMFAVLDLIWSKLPRVG